MPESASAPLQDRWEEFLVHYGYDKKIAVIASTYPEERSLYVKYEDLEHFDVEFADELLRSPIRVLGAGEMAVASIAKMAQTMDEGHMIHLRIKELPSEKQSGIRIGIRDIRAKDMSQFISVEGLVRKANEVRPKVLLAAFRCLRCGHVTTVLQEESSLREPLECEKNEDGGGGCGRGHGSTRFKLLKDISTFVDTEKIEIQEQPEELNAGAQPQTLVAYLEDDIAGQIFPGARIILNGILDSRMRQRGSQGQTTFDIFLNVNSLEFQEEDAYDLDISDEEQIQIDELAANPNVIELIRDSISPTIFGLEFEKEALALQLFGGIAKLMPDNTHIRGDIHILLVGDPGTAKSQLLRHMSDITPRGIYASGKSATSAGLTAAAVKEEFGEGRWTLEAGVLVLADKGLACVDELDKMSKEDRSSMHEAMEQQTISIAKAGINATLQSRCSILGAANPKFGRFTQSDYIADQINLPPTLLSRFDLIFPIYDRPEAAEDERIAEHILNSHLIGEMRVRYKGQGDSDETYDRAKFEALDKTRKPCIDPVLLRKYVFYSKKHKFPVLTREAIDRLKSYYLEVRKLGESSEAKSVPITARQLEGFVRVAEASARARMSDDVSLDDAERAIRIVREYLRRVIGRGGDELVWDSDVLSTGVPHSHQQRRLAINSMMKELLAEDSQGFTLAEVVEIAVQRGIEESRVMAIWEDLRKTGDVYQVGKRGEEPLYKLVHEL
ncbi:MAG: minichromosome maintenance protein MCM [Candidatus Thermoplasmatota archaeon]|nr:minichromosome maintenance protein MCM [Candidatus Thermoplasmatota archaeon]MBU4071486.1 minichromosome maintenance protein MCM [Candidatus Thermoplasmatota archaeon]MBU4144100.1 minichromosome maintenance protein MCM [Candidatus Thermoplasmatota archaeon]MBU4590992.1 minichromosome maintenance protein MCM [Candidatus Thermoplasmatota archaeon]